MSKQQVSIFMGGTGANTASDARTNLGVVAVSGDTMTGNLNVAATLITQNVIPNANITYDLGSSEARFKDLWLSNSTIYLGEASISAQGGNVSFGNAEIQLSNVSTKLNVTNDLFVSGNVGIGTANPTYKLHVAGAGVFGVSSDGVVYWGAAFTGNNRGFLTWDTNSSIFGGPQNVDFSTGGSNRARIDSSGNLLVGTTNTSTEAEGFRFRKDLNAIASVSDGALAAYFGRLTSDGEIIRFRKDSTTIGSIGSEGGDSLYIGNLDAGLKFNGAADVIQPFNTSTVAARDAAISLGTSGARFKDLYLSGGIYLGGTGASNQLDDYEEGTWTPIISDGTNNATAGSNNGGSYTKIGNLVTVIAYVKTSSLGSVTGGIRITGLPFTAVNSVSGGGYASVSSGLGSDFAITAGQVVGVNSVPNATYLDVRLWDDVTGTTVMQATEWSADGQLTFSLTYRV